MKYRKKPLEIEAFLLTGANEDELAEWCGGTYFPPGTDHYDEPRVFINTLEGTMSAHLGDWIIKGVQGEFYPCKPDIFEETYEAVGEETDRDTNDTRDTWHVAGCSLPGDHLADCFVPRRNRAVGEETP